MHSGLFHGLRPSDISRFIEVRFEFDHTDDLFARLRCADQEWHNRALLTRAIQGQTP